MADTNKNKQFFTVARVFFLLIVIPLSLMAILIANGIFKLFFYTSLRDRHCNPL